MTKRSVLLLLSACAIINLILTRSSGTSPFAQIPQNKPIAEIRFQTSFGVVFLPVKVNSGGPYQFLLDTGGGGSLLDRSIADRLGLKQDQGQASASGNSSLSVGIIQNAKLEVGNIKSESRLVTTSFTSLEPIFGRSLEGMLGGDFMSKYVVEFDYDRKMMRLFDIASFRPEKEMLALPLTFSDLIPYITLKVTMPNGKSIEGDFLVDSGGGGMAIHVFKQVVDRESLFEGLKTLDETGYGIGGTTDRLTARGSTVMIGSHRLDGPTVTISPDAANAKAKPGSVGLVGMEVLGRFKLVFDYSRSLLYLKPGRSIDDKFIYDSTGLRLQAKSPTFTSPFVAGLRTGSPAERAGIKSGDVIDKIDGISTNSMSLDEVRQKLRSPDRRIRLTLVRPGQKKEVVLVPHELLN